MSANSSTSVQIAYLNFITREINRYVTIPTLIFGSIGNILNILVFSRSHIRNNPCSLYFLFGSINNLVSVIVGLITPFLGLYNLDPTQRINILCKLRFYFRFTTITLSTWFILFACIDRYFSTSIDITRRSWSSLRIAKRTVIFASLFGFLFPYTELFYCYSVNRQNVCTYTILTCKMINETVRLIFNTGIPPIIMVVISYLTVQQIKHIHFHSNRDTQLVRILLVQVFVLVLFAIPITSQKVYSYITIFETKSPLRAAIESLIIQICTAASYIYNSTTFYVYSLTSKRFRKEVSQIFACQYWRTNIIHPRQLNTSNPKEILPKIN